jgi:hypothetical protein
MGGFIVCKFLSEIDRYQRTSWFACEWARFACKMANLMAGSFFGIRKNNDLGDLGGLF